MDQVKIGKFISECRKKQNLTQMQLAEKLGLTDRAVSKWENGKAMPDSSIMLELCKELDITVNDLLCGEMVSSEDYNKRLEEQLLTVIQEKERSDKLLIRARWALAVIVMVSYTLFYVLSWSIPPEWGILLLLGFTVFIIIPTGILIHKILQKAGYYRCQKCGHTYTPAIKSVWLSFSWDGVSLYCRCPACQQRAWHKKVFKRD